VLPFVNVGGDPEQDYFADGITDDLITGLSKVGDLFVIARNSTFVYKGQAVPIRRVAEDLGVHYVLEGSVRRAGGRIRINVQLIDATTGTHVWAEHYDNPMADIFAVQDQVTQRVVLALAGQLTVERLLREARQQTHSPEAYDALLRALEYMRTYTRENLAIALGYLEQALELDPDYPRVHAELGGLYWSIANDGWGTSFGLSYDEAFTKAKQHLKKAMRVPSPRAHQFISKSHSNEGRYDEAIAEAKKMIALNPNHVLGYETLGRALNKAGRASEGVEAMKMAMRLDPRGDDQGWVSYRLGEALYLSGQFDAAAEAFARSAERNQNEWSYAFLAASHAQAERQEQAKTALATFDRIMADAGEEPYTVAKVEGWAFKFQRDRARVQEGFRKAGMPEGAASTLELDWAQDVSPAEVPGATTIDAATAKNLVDRGVTVVDVREDHYWNDGHVPGAVHLSLYSDFTEAKLAEVVAKDQELVILAHGSAVNPRSARACARAVSWGFSKVYYFREGYPGWQAAGYPIKMVQNQ
jgi:TolB-like protein/rhodanese-related sulfurtransferase